jgi:hypothetical protein
MQKAALLFGFVLAESGMSHKCKVAIQYKNGIGILCLDLIIFEGRFLNRRLNNLGLSSE